MSLKMNSFKTIMASDLALMLRSGQTLSIIDVRESFEFLLGHIPGSINMPLSNFDFESLNKNEEHYLLCATGARSVEAAKVLAQYGYKIVNVMGGTSAYRGPLTR